MTELNKYQTIEDFNVPVSGRRVTAKVTRFSYGDEYPTGVVIPETRKLLLYTQGFPKHLDNFSLGLEMSPGGKIQIGCYHTTRDNITKTGHSFVLVEPQTTSPVSPFILNALEYFYETPVLKALPEDTHVEYRKLRDETKLPFLVMTINGCRLAISVKDVETLWGLTHVLERKEMLKQALTDYLHGILDKAHEGDEEDLHIKIYSNDGSELLNEILSDDYKAAAGNLRIHGHPYDSDRYIIRRESDYYIVDCRNLYGFTYIIDAIVALGGVAW